MSATVARARRPSGVWGQRWARLSRHPTGMGALVVLALLVVFVLAAWPLQHFAGLDPNAADLFSRYQPPSARHWLGTDAAGRDELLRLMLGGQTSLLVGAIATLVGGCVGLLVGVTAGYAGGRVDSVLMRATDGLIALPLLPLLIVLGAVDPTKLGFSQAFAHSESLAFWRVVIIIAAVDWTATARIVRAATLEIKQRDYIRAARAAGGGARYVVMTHVLPNVASPLIVALALTVGRVILFESVLSFLGFGILPPMPSWGNMLTNAQEMVETAPLLAVYPGFLIFITVMAVNFLGDGLRHAFDPRSGP